MIQRPRSGTKLVSKRGLVYSNELNKQANKKKLLLLNQLLITKSFV